MLGYDINPVTGALRLPAPWGRMISPGGVAPSLVIDAGRGIYGRTVGGRLQRIGLAGAVTFSRAGTAMTVGPDRILQLRAPDVARIAHHALSGQSLGLLVEASRTNMMLRSHELSVAPWALTRATVSADVTTPLALDGTQMADRLVADATPDTSHFVQQSGLSLTGAHVYSRFVRAGEISQLAVAFLGGTTPRRAAWDLSAGTVADIPVSTVTQADLGIGIEAWPGGWYRVWAAWTADGQTAVREHLAVSGTINIAGNVSGQGLSLWGAQVEPGTRPTSYIPTTTVAVTRAADSATAAAASWVAAGQGTLIAVGRRLPDGGGSLINLHGANPISDRTVLSQQSDGRMLVQIVNGGATQANLANIGTAPAEGAPFAAAVSWNAGRIAACLNGSVVTASTGSFTFPAQTTLRLGGRENTSWNGTLGRALYFPVALPDADIQAITAALAA